MATPLNQDKMFNDFDDIQNTEVSGRGNFHRVGRHLVIARSATWRQSQKNKTVKVWVSEHTVVKSTPEAYTMITAEEESKGWVPNLTMPQPHAKGSQTSWTIDNGKTGYDGRIKQWLLAVKGSIRSGIEAGLLTAEEADELGAMWDLKKAPENIEKQELITAVTNREAVAGWPLWVNCQRTRTVSGKIIDGCNFQPLSADDWATYKDEILPPADDTP